VLTDVDATLFTGSNRISTSTGLAAGSSVAFQRVGAFPLDATTTDAALVAQLTAGSYTVHAIPATGATRREGNALIEVYEDGVRGTQLVNLSARTELGAEPLIVGFVVAGNAKSRVLIRAVGPGLTAFNLTGLVADPRIDLIGMSDGQTIAQNDDWGTNAAAVTSASTASGAFALTAGSRDAALVVDLDPGAYTVRVQNSSNASGIVLAELFQVPQ